jgi:hypothetical protein
MYFTQQGIVDMKLSRRLSIGTCLIVALLATSAQAVPPSNVTGLTGTWYNTNSSTGGITKIVVVSLWGGLLFKSYGACHPTDCEHSWVWAYPHSASVSSNTAVGFTSYRNSGFAYSKFSAKRVGALLRLDDFTTFASGDSRKDYVSSEYFRR